MQFSSTFIFWLTCSYISKLKLRGIFEKKLFLGLAKGESSDEEKESEHECLPNLVVSTKIISLHHFRHQKKPSRSSLIW
jgi:hypothetical protein